MKAMSTHDKIKTQIVAFLFNSRADVLRSEMFRALCLHVLNEIDAPCDIVQLTELVAYTIDSNVKSSPSLQTVISDELQILVDKGKVLFKDGLYSLDRLEKMPLPDKEEENELNRVIKEEVGNIARSIDPDISKSHINKLIEFYFAVCNVVAKERMMHLAQGGRLDISYTDFGELSETIEKIKIEYEVEKVIDCEEFVNICFINPNDVLSKYAFTLIQVNIILQLLTWDPALENIEANVLRGKTLYLDSSILFPMMISSDRLHDFINSLIAASVNELGVIIKVHENTLKEYDSVIRYHGVEFDNKKLDLKQIAITAKKENISPKVILDDSIFADYLINSIDHVDSGSWQRYTNVVSVDALQRKLKELNINIDSQSTYVPTSEFFRIKSNIIRASIDHSHRSRRFASKTDATHDAQIYYHLNKIRHKMSGKFSFGYDTYLLTMDGSLITFAQYHGVAWSDTYFLFPNQWYELAFPFLRVKISENPLIARNFASMAFSNVFTKLEKLIPLQMFSYIFEGGGLDLTLSSIQGVADAMQEGRLIERLDPTNKDIKAREEAKLNLQRIIADKLVEQNRIIEKLEYQRQQLKNENKSLETGINEKQEVIRKLENDFYAKETEIENLEKKISDKKSLSNIQSHTEDLRRRLEKTQQEQIDEITSYYNAELEATQEIFIRERQLGEEKNVQLSKLSDDIASIKEAVSQSQKEKDNLEKEKQKLVKENAAIMGVIRWVIFTVFLILFSYVIWTLELFGRWVSEGKGLIITKILAQLIVTAILLLIPFWKQKKWLFSTAILGLVSLTINLLPDILR